MTFDEFYHNELNLEFGCDKVRKTIINIWMTEVMEDTVDREWFNFSVLRLTRQMMHLYGVHPTEIAKIPKPGEYPIYKACIDYNPDYHINNANRPVWMPVHDDVLNMGELPKLYENPDHELKLRTLVKVVNDLRAMYDIDYIEAQSILLSNDSVNVEVQNGTVNN